MVVGCASVCFDRIYEKIMRPVIGGMKNDISVMATACNNLGSTGKGKRTRLKCCC